MSNPYAAPKARLDDAPTPGEAPYFAVSRVKLALMSVGTLGLYQIYWFYKNWKGMQASGEKLNAPIRAVFYPVTAYWLFRHVNARAAAVGVAARHQAGWLAAGIFIIYAVTYWLPDPWWMAGFATILLFFPVQATVDQINLRLAPGAGANARFSGWNIFGMIAGALVLLLVLVGMFVPLE